MRELKMKLCALMLPLVVSACGSTPPAPGTVREATGTSGVDNATGPRLADTAERDYFTLRERLMLMQKQLEVAQEYIRTQCLK
ncbi:Endopeptidase (Lysis protein) from bacteriophage origin [Escherichia coli]|uniref:Endopeptidase (Lysis protein) from bacteriophage origin n=1 Tax=Escherichia coli TaxID=562 RepID=A0A376LL16_ECOLX|nr:Endopeptidase (Lysis protein) from bacteriophage origin [Escherichia coli]